MNRQEAEKLIGQKCLAWTSANGEYVGILEEVIPKRPFRAKIRITGVLSPACVFDVTRFTPRKGFRPGDSIEIGGVNLKTTDLEGGSYLDALKGELAGLEDSFARANGRVDRWTAHLPSSIKKVKEAIERESAHQKEATK